jgi:hypothetical protein
MIDQCKKDWPIVLGPEMIDALSLVHKILGGKAIHVGKSRADQGCAPAVSGPAPWAPRETKRDTKSETAKTSAQAFDQMSLLPVSTTPGAE